MSPVLLLLHRYCVLIQCRWGDLLLASLLGYRTQRWLNIEQGGRDMCGIVRVGGLHVHVWDSVRDGSD